MQLTGQFCKQLQALPGIGEWTAQYVAMRVLKDPDAFPASDLGLLKAIAPLQKVTPQELSKRAESWQPWRAYAAMHLWNLITDTDVITNADLIPDTGASTV